MGSPALDMSLRINREDFLKEEVLCGFRVTTKMKKVFKVQLDMLEVVQDICKRHGLHYLLCGGSLLGAVRHKGYIPWDDDIDISMLRPDYDKFVKIANEELKPPYFLQTTLSDPNCDITFAKLRNSNTTAIVPGLLDRQGAINQGVFIDIFPVDGVPNNHTSYRRQIMVLNFLSTILGYAHMTYNPGGLRAVKKLLLKIVFKVVGLRRICEWRESILRKYGVDECKKSGQISFFGLNTCTNLPIRYFRDAVEVPFEYLYVRIPRECDAVLTAQYGDWHKIVKGTQYHGGLYFDPECPYEETLKKGIKYE